MAREHIGHAGKGRTCRNAGVRITRCGTLALGNETGVQSKARTSIGGISLQNALSGNLAMRLGRFSAVDENVHPVSSRLLLCTGQTAWCKRSDALWVHRSLPMWESARTSPSTEPSAARQCPEDPDTRCHSVTIWTTMKPQCAVNRAKNQPFKRATSTLSGRNPRSAERILRLSWLGSCAKGEVGWRSTVARPLVLSPVLGFVGGSRLFWMTSRRVESLREHIDVSPS